MRIIVRVIVRIIGDATGFKIACSDERFFRKQAQQQDNNHSKQKKTQKKTNAHSRERRIYTI